MPIQLLPMEESDIDAHIDIMWAAFGPDLLSIFYPGGDTPTARAHMKADNLSAMRKPSSATDSYLFIKAVDTDRNNEIVSTAKWQTHATPRTEAELDAEAAQGAGRENLFCAEANADAMKAFFTELAVKRRERFGGEPYVLLSILAVHPDHQRRGLGALQLLKGLERADELGAPAYLESSPKGKGLYAKHGFEDLGNMEFDARRFGAAFDVPHTFMLRPARARA